MSDPTTAANPFATSATAVGAGNVAQSSQGLTVQVYCNSVNQQPQVDFSGTPSLSSYETQINTGLLTAQGHANNYLANIQPNIIQNIANISNYYALYGAVGATLPPNATDQQWIEVLGALQTQSTAYQTAANAVVASLNTFSAQVSSDSASFAQTVVNLNAAVGGG